MAACEMYAGKCLAAAGGKHQDTAMLLRLDVPLPKPFKRGLLVLSRLLDRML